MQAFVTTLLKNLEENLKFIQLEMDDVLKQSEASVEVCKNAFGKLKQVAIKHKFKEPPEEITFFKTIKPQFASKLIFYTEIFTITCKQPNGSHKTQRKYFLNELDKLKAFFDANLDFYQYYRMQSTYLDDKYFMRGKHDIRLYPDAHLFETDPKFSTNCDYKISKIIANDLLSVYLNTKLESLERKENITHSKISSTPKTKLKWTGSKVALIELVYALYAAGVFNDGKTDIKEIADYFETAFNIELGDYYRTYLEIRIRKSGRTKFLDSLKDSFIKKMDQLDEK